MTTILGFVGALATCGTCIFIGWYTGYLHHRAEKRWQERFQHARKVTPIRGKL